MVVFNHFHQFELLKGNVLFVDFLGLRFAHRLSLIDAVVRVEAHHGFVRVITVIMGFICDIILGKLPDCIPIGLLLSTDPL